MATPRAVRWVVTHDRKDLVRALRETDDAELGYVRVSEDAPETARRRQPLEAARFPDGSFVILGAQAGFHMTATPTDEDGFTSPTEGWSVVEWESAEPTKEG